MSIDLPFREADRSTHPQIDFEVNIVLMPCRQSDRETGRQVGRLQVDFDVYTVYLKTFILFF